jgi:hypothetical protein
MLDTTRREFIALIARTRFMSVPTHSLTPTGFASTHWRSAHDYQRCMGIRNPSRREA